MTNPTEPLLNSPVFFDLLQGKIPDTREMDAQEVLQICQCFMNLSMEKNKTVAHLQDRVATLECKTEEQAKLINLYFSQMHPSQFQLPPPPHQMQQPYGMFLVPPPNIQPHQHNGCPVPPRTPITPSQPPHGFDYSISPSPHSPTTHSSDGTPN